MVVISSFREILECRLKVATTSYCYFHEFIIHQMSWSGCSSFLKSIGFKSLPGNWVSWMRILVVFLSPSRDKLTSACLFSLLSFLKENRRLMSPPFCLCVCQPPHALELLNQLVDNLWNSVGSSCHWRWHLSHNFQSRSFNHSKMKGDQTSEVHAKLAQRHLHSNRGRHMTVSSQYN
jgi:hypothetical protein